MAQILNICFIKLKKEEKMLKRNKGFSLIELMIVVAIIAILAMILTPNLLMAIQKSKQKSTMEDIRNIGMAVDNYMTDWGGSVQITGFDQLKPYVNPFYIKKYPEHDHWNGPYHYIGAGDSYTVASGGKDKAMQVGWSGTGQLNMYEPPTKLGDFNKDIVYNDGSFTYAPKQH
jgi:general secretion pathway protein G